MFRKIRKAAFLTAIIFAATTAFVTAHAEDYPAKSPSRWLRHMVPAVRPIWRPAHWRKPHALIPAANRWLS